MPTLKIQMTTLSGTYNHNNNYTSTPQKVPKEGGSPWAKPLQTYNDNYTNTLQKVPQEGGPPRAKPLQAYNHSYSYTSTLQNAPQEGGPTRTLPPQTYNHNDNYTSALQKIEEKPLPVSVIKANQWKLLLPTKLSQVRVLPYVLPWPQQSQWLPSRRLFPM